MTPHKWEVFEKSNKDYQVDKYICRRCGYTAAMSTDRTKLSSNWNTDCDLAVIENVTKS